MDWSSHISFCGEQPAAGPRELVRALGLTLLTAGVAATLGVVLLSRDAAPPADGPARADRRAALRASPGSDARAPAPALVPADPPAPVIYVVASEEQAASVLAGLREADAIRVWLGEPPLSEQVVVVRSEEEELRLRRSLLEHDTIRGGLRLPPLHIVDLREPDT